MNTADAKEKELFETMPVSRAVISLAIPTVISQLITVVYNMADTFFIGKLNDPVQVAAATVAMPPFVFLTGIANLFGLGGSSLISRNMGLGKNERGKNCSSFAFWSAVAIGILYGLIFMIFRPVLLPLIGTTEETYQLAYQYVLWTVTIGAAPTVANTVLAHLIRTEGAAKESSFGLTLGGLLNIGLDPLFIFVFRMGIQGAAIATMLSNIIALVYFLIILRLRKGRMGITIHPRYFTVRYGIPKETILTGLPSFIMTLMSFFSNTTLNYLISRYSSEAVAGMGIAKKVDMIGFAIAQGMTQGVLALIGYNYAAGNIDRMKKVIRTTVLYSLAFAAVGSVCLFLFAPEISALFINQQETIQYGARFIRTLCVTLPTSSVTMMIITVYQATGQKIQPMILSMLRKGGLDVPFMILLNSLGGILTIAFATPIADVLTLLTAIVMFVPYWKSLSRRGKTEKIAGEAV